MRRVSICVGVIAALAACSGPPKQRAAPPPVVALPLAAADLQGTWRATDVDGWTYDLAIQGDRFEQTITRTAGGPCLQKGALQGYEKLYGSPYMGANGMGLGYGGATYGARPGTILALVMSLEENQCNPDYTGAQLVVLAQDYDGTEVTLRSGVGYGGAEESHRYAKVVAAAAPPP